MRTPNLIKDEKILLWSQCTLYMKDSWQQGYIFLTNIRLIFNHIAKQTLETRLDAIKMLSIEKRGWLLGIRVKQICIDFITEKGQERVYLALAKPKEWSHKIKEAMTLMLVKGWSYNGTNTESTRNT